MKSYRDCFRDRRWLTTAQIDDSGGLRAVTFSAAGLATMGFAHGSNKHGGLRSFNLFTVLWNKVINNRHQTNRVRVGKLMKPQRGSQIWFWGREFMHFEDCVHTVSVCLQATLTTKGSPCIIIYKVRVLHTCKLKGLSVFPCLQSPGWVTQVWVDC